MKRYQAFGILAFVVVAIGGYAVCQRSRAPSTGQRPIGTTTEQAVRAIPVSSEVRALMDDLTKKFDSVSALYAETEMKLDEAAGMPGNTRGKGKYWLKRADGRLFAKFATGNDIFAENPKANPPSQIWTKELVWQLYDGEHLYLLIQQRDYNKARKVNYDPDLMLQLGGTALFRSLAEGNDLTLLDDEEIDGRPAYVIQATPHNGDWVGKHWFDKETGVRLQVLETRSDGSEYFHFAVRNLNLTPEFAEDQFRFVLPPDFDFTDETGGSAASDADEGSDAGTSP